MKLGDIKTINDKIDSSDSKDIQVLHQFIYEIKKSDRECLKNFKGFKEEKLKYVRGKLHTDDLVKCCTILNLNSDGNDSQEELVTRLFNALINISTLSDSQQLQAADDNQHNTEKNKNAEVTDRQQLQAADDNQRNIKKNKNAEAVIDPLKKWITHVETIASSLQLTEQNKIIFAKKSFMLLIKTWIENIETWESLKKSLKELPNTN